MGFEPIILVGSVVLTLKILVELGPRGFVPACKGVQLQSFKGYVSIIGPCLVGLTTNF